MNSTRTQRNSGKISAERIAKLDAVGFAWGATSREEVAGEGINRAWKTRYDELVRYKAIHGDCEVLSNWSENPELGRWVSQQRQQKKSGKLHLKRVEMLQTIGFDWGVVRDELWPDRYNQLVKFKELHSHCDVPTDWPEDPQFGAWVVRQRHLKKSGKLLPDRYRMLNGIDFAWVSTRKETPPQMRNAMQEPVTASWEKCFDDLTAYQQAHGNCDMPVKWKENPQLGGWAAAQRALRKAGKLHPERERLLNGIGFEWRADRNKEEWETRFDQLNDYKQRFGDSCVPVKWQEKPQLGAWVAQQRHFQKVGKLSPEKEKRLTDLGFVWANQRTTTGGVNRAWNDWFNELVQYKAKYGDCKVPTRWDENRRFGVWVSNQRQLKKQEKLEPERERMLNEIGFVWGNPTLETH